MLTRLSVMGLLLLLTVSCSVGMSPHQHKAEFQPPRWSRVRLAAPISVGAVDQLAGWDGGYLLVGVQPVSVKSSIDGHNWRSTTLPGLTALEQNNPDDRLTAGYGTSAYVVGSSSNKPAVWRTADGRHWQKTFLDVEGLTYPDTIDLNLNIVAGPHGIIVVGYDAVAPPSFYGLYVWRSFDHGNTFGRPIRMPLKANPSDTFDVGAVQATVNGFLVGAQDGSTPTILSSVNGFRWISISSERQAADTYAAWPIDGNASTVVMFNWNAKTGQPLAMYRRRNTWYPSTVDPGRLPDAGVVPINQITVNAVCNWGTGFIAIGNVNAAGAQFSGMAWYSADGSHWIRQPVRTNGFNAVAHFLDAAVSNGKALIIAEPAKGLDLLIWQTIGADNLLGSNT